MKKIQSIAALCGAVLLAASLFGGCASPDEPAPSSAASEAPAPVEMKVAGIKGPTGIGMVGLMQASDDKTTKNTYTFTVMSGPEEAQAKLSTGEVDIAAVPTNLAAALYNKTNGEVQMLAVNTLGVLYIMENGDSIQSVADLKGKTIYSTGQGANPEYVLRYVLEKNGLDPDKDVTIEFRSENDELATLLATGEAEVALVPEPVVTTAKLNNADLNVVLNMTEEWEKAAGGASDLMMGCVAVRTDFAKENPQAVADFLTEYEASIQQAIDDVDGTAALCEKYGIIPKAAVAKQAIPRCNLTFVAGDEMKNRIGGYLEVLFTANPQSIGGKLPDDAFYYMG